MLKVFISGLERQTGKTIVGAGLAATMQSLSYSTSVYKPIQTNATVLHGFKTSPDLTVIKKFDPNISTDATYVLKSSAPPFISSYEDGVKIDINTIYNDFLTVDKNCDCLIVEGSNSIATPIAEHFTELDLVKSLNLPLILVINPKVTPVERALIGINYIQNNHCRFLGVILNRFDEDSDVLEEKYYPQILKEFVSVKVLGTIPDYDKIQTFAPELLIADTLNHVNIEEIFGLKIAKLND